MKRLATGAASLIWSSLSSGVREATRKGWLASEKLDAGRVISVGNLQAGGAGKTPLVAQIANEGARRGKRVCILCRGYGGEWELEGGTLRPGTGAKANAFETGDEAALLAELAPEAWIAVGADRARQYACAVLEAGKAFDLVVLDDGFQHWKIRKDLEIVALTSRGPTETLYRDFAKAASAADLLVWTKGERTPQVPASRPLIRVRFELPESTWKGVSTWLVSGVGDNAAALESAKQAGYRVQKHFEFRDHAVYEPVMIRELLKKSADASCRIAITGKDWVKWRSSGITKVEVIVLEPELKFDGNARAVWDRVLWGES